MSVRNTLLGLLSQQSCHGYELLSLFEALSGGRRNWEVKPAQIYTTLNRLEDKDLIARGKREKTTGPERQFYRITPKGESELKTWLLKPVEATHQRDEFYLKLMVNLVSDVVDPYELIYIQRTHLYRELHRYSRLKGSADASRELAYVLFLESVVMHLEADLRWLEMIESKLDEIRTQPVPEPEVRKQGRPRKQLSIQAGSG
jgi:DNA-binding PadR family transcriptional regulator